MGKGVLVLDNGAHTLKAGFDEPYIMPNAIMRTGNSKKVFVGDEILTSATETSYAPAKWWKRPAERGIVVDWNLQQKIWDRAIHQVFQTQAKDNDAWGPIADLSFEDLGLLYTQPPLCPPMLQNVTHEVAFELYGFNSLYRCSPSFLSLHDPTWPTKSAPSPCCVVVDSGYSFTHIMPFVDGQLVHEGVKRIQVGGKLLDNYLKEVISFRQWNVLEESYLMTHIKEQLCFVSLHFQKELKQAQMTNDLHRQWVLPNVKGDLGHLKNDATPASAQMLKMNNERFAIPEILFHPNILGIEQAGIVESIVQSIQSCPPLMHEALYSNIQLIGGNSLFPNYRERIFYELRSYAPTEYALQVTEVPEPMTSAWRGGRALVQNGTYDQICVTKEIYQEEGHQGKLKTMQN